jgi:hypothetical protein
MESGEPVNEEIKQIVFPKFLSIPEDTGGSLRQKQGNLLNALRTMYYLF